MQPLGTAGPGETMITTMVRTTAHVLCASRRHLLVAIVCAAQLAGSAPVRADPVPETMNGVPLLPIPTYDEVGLPPFTMPTGTLSTVPDQAPILSATGPEGTSSVALDTMLSKSWGAAAGANAESLGVSATAQAVTCVLESNCQNVGGTGTINGAFQMSDATYTAAMASALRQNPNLAANIVPGLAGKLDSATQSIAAAEYLRQGAQYLQAHDVQNPSVLDVRGYYNFGPGNAVSIAQANGSDLMSDQIRGLSSAQLVANGINPGVTTVGQWRTGITNKIGSSAANTTVLLSPS